MAPISLVILNPIGLILMEIGKAKSSNDRLSEQEEIEGRFSNPTNPAHQTNIIRRMLNIQNRNCKMCFQIIIGVVTNPLIFMTFLGVFCGTYVFKDKGNIKRAFK